MYRRKRSTLQLQLAVWFVVALLTVEGTVLFAYWVAREQPLISSTVDDLQQALEEVRATAEQRDLYLWRNEELASLALRAEIDLLSVVTHDGTQMLGDDAMFPRETLRALIEDGTATWTLAAVNRTDPSHALEVGEGPPGDPPVGGDKPPRGPSEESAPAKGGSSVLRYPEWPVVGAALPFNDVYGHRAYLIGARTAPAAAPPLLIRAVTWMGLIGFFSATVAAWVVIGRALRPLHELAQSALKISPEHRDERLSAGGQQAEVEDAKRALNDALDRLEAGYDALDLFIGNVTHELRTPIASVLAEARQISLRARSAEDYAAFVTSTGDEMARLGKMIQSFLTLARMDWEERRGVIVPVPLLDVAVDVSQHVRVAAQQQRVHIVLQLTEHTDLEVEGDQDLITSMLDNVVRNAVRFSPAGGEVQVTITADEQSARIVVRDHGPGIPESLIEAAFLPYVQGRPVIETELGQPTGSSKAGRGSGIGLAIAQKVVELHHGAIHIGNHAEGGCEVVIALPLKVAEVAAGQSVPRDDAAQPSAER